MPRRIAVQTLNASTLDILNVIRQNASYDYQQNVPVVETATDIPRVGEIIYGTPAFANQFINSLVNRIAIVRVQSATFNNPYAHLKRGYLEYGESIEEIFVNIAKAVEYTPEKAPAREFRRTIPDVRSAFHVMNWRVMYPVTIQDEDLRMAFLSADGVTNLIAKIVDTVYTAAEYDEYLLFKYLLIKAIAKGKVYPVSIGDGSDLKEAAVQYRGMSNVLPFMKDLYNEAKVRTTTPKSRQIIFMDAMYNAQFDVDVLSSAFNMDKADFMGRLHLIDDWTTFDNERFEIIRSHSDGIEEVTEDELALMSGVKAVLMDEEWFQVYDNNNKFTEKYVASGLYWNYFYHTWKTISNSPFSNAVVFATTGSIATAPAQLTFEVGEVEVNDDASLFTLYPTTEIAGILNTESYQFVQTEDATTKGIAVTKYGAFMLPKGQTTVTPVLTLNSEEYTADAVDVTTIKVGDSVTLKK